LNQYFLTDGRRSSVVRKYMYDTDTLPYSQNAYMVGSYLQKDLNFPNIIDYAKNAYDSSNPYSIQNNLELGPYATLPIVTKYGIDVATSILNGASNTIDAGLSGIKELFGGEATASRAIPYLNINDYTENSILQAAYIGNKNQNYINERLNQQSIA